MPVPAMLAAIGWKPQTAFETYPTGAYYWHKMLESTFQPVEFVQLFPPEVGGGLLPAGVFKGGVYSGGALNCAPRLDEALGFLIWNLCGTATVTGSGPYMHVFPGRNDNQLPNNWLTFRRMIQNEDGSNFGETYQDCRLGSLIISGVPGNLVNLRMQTLGMLPVPTDPASGEGWAPSTDNGGYEPYTGVPITTVSDLFFDGVAMKKVQNVTITINNNLPNPRDMLVIGQYTPLDFPVLQRSVTVQMTAFWQSPALYKKVYYGAGSTWTPALMSDTFEVNFRTPGNLAGQAYPGILGFWVNTGAISWQCEPIDLRGGDLVVMRMTGTVNALASDEEWRIYLQNSRSTAYAAG